MLCKCGCGQAASRGKDYVSGHNLIHLPRTRKHCEGISKAQKIAWQTKRTRFPIGSMNRDNNGYVRVKVTEGNGEWRREHELIMEQHLGRELANGESIHHINGIRNDNRIENLCLCKNKSEHKRIEDSCKTLVLSMLQEGRVIFDREAKQYRLAT